MTDWLEDIRIDMKGKLSYGKLLSDIVRMAHVLRELVKYVTRLEKSKHYVIREIIRREQHLSDDAKDLLLSSVASQGES